MAYAVPESSDQRRSDLNQYLNIYKDEYEEFKTKGKKAAGARSKKALTVVKKLITAVRKDIQEEINATRKVAKAPAAKTEAPKAEEAKASEAPATE